MNHETLERAAPAAEAKGRQTHERLAVVRGTADKGRADDALALWYDSKAVAALADGERRAVLERVYQGRFNGICLYVDNFRELAPRLPGRFTRALHLDGVGEWDAVVGAITLQAGGQEIVEIHVIASGDAQVLARARAAGFRTCLRMQVVDATSLHASFHDALHHQYLMVSFKDPTNIPLELVIAELHLSNTIVMKEVHDNVADAVIALGVLELGSDGVVVTFTQLAQFDEFANLLDSALTRRLELAVGTIVRTKHLGLGYRACIDTTHMFAPTEGMLVGSTSSGGFLCCPEVFYLPYMDLRPFRINAASIHSYVYQANGRTNYISELAAGVAVTAVDAGGRARHIYVGRVKTEIRPLILIEARFPGDRTINIVMQDDWHVRIFSDQATPLNVTELKAGDKVLGHVTEPGRHVGVKVNEHIIES